MNTRDLQYLVALAEFRHFGKAADSCFVSQPGLSMQIKKLEQALGVQLIERTNKSVMLTDIGLQVANRARDILRQVEELQELAATAKDPASGELRLGVIPTLAPYLLPHIVPALTKKFPKLSIYLIEEQTAFLLEKLKSGTIHAAMLALPIPDPQLTTTPLFEETFLLATPSSHPLAKHKSIKQSDLHHQGLLLLEEGHCMREQTLSYCHRIHAHESSHFKATSLETLRHMVMSGIGMTLMPALACKHERQLAYIPFSQPKPQRTIGLCWRASSSREKVLLDLSGEITRIIKDKI